MSKMQICTVKNVIKQNKSYCYEAWRKSEGGFQILIVCQPQRYLDAGNKNLACLTVETLDSLSLLGFQTEKKLG